MRIPVDELIEGCILAKNINSLSNTPIIPKKTVIDQKLINVIRAFLLEEVDVEDYLENGARFKPMRDVTEKQIANALSFPKQYIQAVQEYKKLFKNWQAGSPIDISKIREAIVPVLEMAVNSLTDVFRLHHYGTKEDYYFHHAVSVAIFSTVLASRLNYQKGDTIQIGIAGVLSDCGMAKTDPWIINKKGQLTKEEYYEIKKHPEHSYNMLKQVPVITDSMRQGVLQHHERIDGSGYPLGLQANSIHPYAKIISVADMFHAMISERFYKPKQSPFKVLEAIIQDSFGKFDLRVVQALTVALTSFSTGTRVELSNQEIGEIVFIEQKYPTRPMVRLDSGEIINLVQAKDLFIEKILT